MVAKENEIYIALLIISGFLLVALLFFVVIMIINHFRLRRMQQMLVKSEIIGSESERRRMSETLHDDINPTLTLGLMYLQMLELKDEKNIDMMEKARTIINDTIFKVRMVSHDLSPYLIGENGLIACIEQHLEKVRELNSIDIDLEVRGKNPKLSIEGMVDIYRIVQESINNVIRHAQATHLRIGFYVFEKDIHIIISDNGIGFHYSYKSLFDTDSTKGIGIKSIYNRVVNLSGTLDIQTKSGGGTKLIIILPNQ
ncbi:MAG: hypothetical protein IAE67_07995 [Candidatus Competibacteraceae bacterium]|nr:hypothetical protein [Candidatus Competibacteraceae bacterium]